MPINQNELLFVVDADNNPLEPLPRHEVHSKHLWHRVSHIWVVNSKGQILCQKRSMLKDMHPGEWEACFGGHQSNVENELENAVNELAEELGLKAKPPELKFYQVFKKHGRPPRYHNEFIYIYLYRWDGDISFLKLEADEVDRIEWKNQADIREKIKTKDPKWTHHIYEPSMLDWIAGKPKH